MDAIGIVLAGGLGTRLRSVMPNLPKCLSPVGGKPFLEHVLAYLRGQGIERVVLAVGHRGEAIRDYFGVGARVGMEIQYSDEGTKLRGTGGALAQALEGTAGAPNELVLIMNGDSYVEFSLADMIRKQSLSQARLVLVAARVRDSSRYGRLELGPHEEVVGFREKGEVGPGVVSAGVYLGRRAKIESFLPKEDTYSMESAVLPRLAGNGLFAWRVSGLFIDIGLPETYRQADALFSKMALR